MTDPGQSVGEASTKAERKRALEAKAWTIRCVKCGARADEGCVSSSGERCGTHAVRIRHAAYLPVPE